LMGVLVYYSGLGVFIAGYFGAMVHQLIMVTSIGSGEALT